jgi:hypothetical protein
MSITLLGAEIDSRFDGVGELLLEGVVNVHIFMPLAEVLHVLLDGLIELHRCGGRRYDLLGARIDCDGEGLASGNIVVHV